MGFAPNLPSNEAALDVIAEAVAYAGYELGKDVTLALDCAAQEFYDGNQYLIDGKLISGSELADIYSYWIHSYPIVSIEDPFGEDDWNSWIEFNKKY